MRHELDLCIPIIKIGEEDGDLHDYIWILIDFYGYIVFIPIGSCPPSIFHLDLGIPILLSKASFFFFDSICSRFCFLHRRLWLPVDLPHWFSRAWVRSRTSSLAWFPSVCSPAGLFPVKISPRAKAVLAFALVIFAIALVTWSASRPDLASALAPR
jgi:hypothetical protein